MSRSPHPHRSVTLLLGDPRAGTPMRAVAEELAARISGLVGADLDTLDLARGAREVFAWPSPVMDGLVDRVREAEVLVVASPALQGSFSGLVKGFLDRIDGAGLAGVPAVPLIVSAHATDSCLPDGHLARVLRALGASVLPGFHLLERHSATPVAAIDTWMQRNGPAIDAAGRRVVRPLRAARAA